MCSVCVDYVGGGATGITLLTCGESGLDDPPLMMERTLSWAMM